MTDKVFYVYAHYKKDTNEIFYIGKGKYAKNSKFKRANERHGHNKLWERIADKYGYAVKILEQDITEKEAFNTEINLIKKYGRIDKKTGILSNCTNGGDGSTGAIYSKERIEKTAAANRGRKITAEHKLRISIANKGKPVSSETRLKLSIALTGKIVSAETRLKLSELNKGKKLSVETIEKMKGRKLTTERKKEFQDAGRISKIKKVIDDSTGIIYESLVDAAKATGYRSQTLSRYLRGDRKNKTSMRYL